jgi:hypothetical protein
LAKENQVMATEQQTKPVKEPVKAPDPHLGDVGRVVLNQYGKPPHFHHMEVRHLWADRYRVNVFVEVPNKEVVVRSLQIASSYFVRRLPDGKIVKDKQ